MTSPHRSGQRDTAQEHQFDVQIHYPYHPRHGQRLPVIRSVLHGGRLHFVVDFPDGTRGLLPAWMTTIDAARCPLVVIPRLPVAALRALRSMIASEPLSSASSNESREDGTNGSEGNTITAARSFDQGVHESGVSAVHTRDPGRGPKSTQTTSRRMHHKNKHGDGS